MDYTLHESFHGTASLIVARISDEDMDLVSSVEFNTIRKRRHAELIKRSCDRSVTCEKIKAIPPLD
ncbi:hypothetical protein Dimus_031592, partial [Dionaea muscipula]